MITGIVTLLALTILNGIAILVSYISSGSLPDPLSPEEERELLLKMATGDKLAKTILIERNLRLVAKIANKLKDSGVDKQDLFQVGVIGLIKGVDTFDIKKARKFSTYAGVCIQNEMLMMLRKQKSERNTISISEPLDFDKDGSPLELQDTLANNEIPVDELVEKSLDVERLEKALQTLNPREKIVIKLRYGLEGERELTQREVGKRLDISRSFISRIESSTINKLCREMSHS
ncbi:RNA polymerase, sigma 28 subunit, FliA/WhiG family [Desulforamulus reducens MI-1]|uniref:RNA polymerase sigma factor n=1 Tax=Desulforamulus reducens (strain ATCC BAA-1160 / DSM 100696 / MI-1) TaxID=349161 RepID=A4J7V8_DESRM|nr:RNA polymerase sporulation sigma factor SigK [Desulforamulus reducens]ABO51161.1 RNA polymerase, sigma 28 subunit, FliA/WhiG family [Desulforamulus reducens MI-1]